MPLLKHIFFLLLATGMGAATAKAMTAAPAAGSAAQPAPDVVINEVQASNDSTVADEDGDYEDWIELFNTGADTVDLHGFGLSDDASRPWRWVFPEGTRIDPGGFLLIWASGKDRRTPGAPLHTGFSIRSEGEEVHLSSFTIPDGADSPVIDRLGPTLIRTDYSFGRYPDGSDSWRLFDEPTPGDANRASPWQGEADPPGFSHPPGFYTSAFELTMDAGHHDAVIHYTRDGSVPTTEDPVYEGSVTIDSRDQDPDEFAVIPTGPQFWKEPLEPVFKGQVVRAVAVRDGFRVSEPVAGTWFVHPEGAGRYTLPVVSISADPEHFFSDSTGIMVPGDTFDPDDIVRSGNYAERGEEWERPANLTFFDIHSDPFSPHRSGATGEPASGNVNGSAPVNGFTQNIGIRIHGGSTRRYPQKSLRIYARSAYDRQPDISWPLFPGLRKAGSDEPLTTWKRLILRSSGDDWFHTMFKDAMIQSLYTDRRIDQQAYRTAVVFINGEYWGIHNIRERLDGWYVETNYGIHRDDVAILVDDAAINRGTAADREHYLEMRRYARDNDLSDPEHFAYMQTRMDMDNYIDLYLLHVYAANADWPHNNMRYWRKRTPEYRSEAPFGADGRWRWMIFDLDASFAFPYLDDTAWWAQYDHDTIEWITGTGNPRLPQTWVNELFNSLIENGMFRTEFISRLAGYLNTRFKPGFVSGRIAEFREVFMPEIPEHQRRYEFSAGRDIAGWEGHIDAMTEFARKRPAWLRLHLMHHFEIPDTVRLELEVEDAMGGYVEIDGIPIHPKTPGVPDDHSQWSGTYFQDVPVSLSAVPANGYTFLEWRGADGLPLDFNEISVENATDPGEKSFRWIPEGSLQLIAVFEPTEVSVPPEEERSPIPDCFRLLQNYPNPFNPQTVIPYELPERSRVTITIYSVDGRLIKSKQESMKEPGRHQLRLDMQGMASGLYIYRMQADPESGGSIRVGSGRMTLIR
ncbi:MAG: CotH kinase family protein [Cyclonatronaceae bacterium]